MDETKEQSTEYKSLSTMLAYLHCMKLDT